MRSFAIIVSIFLFFSCRAFSQKKDSSGRARSDSMILTQTGYINVPAPGTIALHPPDSTAQQLLRKELSHAPGSDIDTVGPKHLRLSINESIIPKGARDTK